MRKQLNIAMCYAYFFYPPHVVRGLLRFDDLWFFRMMHQQLGMLRIPASLFNDRGWLWRLMNGPVERLSEPPTAKFSMVAVDYFEPEIIPLVSHEPNVNVVQSELR